MCVAQRIVASAARWGARAGLDIHKKTISGCIRIRVHGHEIETQEVVRALRGNKTDRIDAARIAEYLQYGLLRGSFVPPRPIRELRDLTRSRVHFQQDRNRVLNRMARLLETVNIKLSSVASNIAGKSGRRILVAIVTGARSRSIWPSGQLER